MAGALSFSRVRTYYDSAGNRFGGGDMRLPWRSSLVMADMDARSLVAIPKYRGKNTADAHDPIFVMGLADCKY